MKPRFTEVGEVRHVVFAYAGNIAVWILAVGKHYLDHSNIKQNSRIGSPRQESFGHKESTRGLLSQR